MQKNAQVCKSMQKYSKAYSNQKQILWRLFPAFFQIWNDFSKKNKFSQRLFRRLLMALLTIFYGFLDNFLTAFLFFFFVQYKIRLAQYKTLITFFRGGCKSLS